MKSKKRTLRILHLEDSQSIIALVEKTLQDALPEYEIKKAKSEKEFLKFVIRFNPDVIVSGNQLEKYSASEAIDLLKSERYHIPFIVFADKLKVAETNQLIEKGAEACVVKSNLQLLPISIMKALENSKMNIRKEEAEHHLKYQEERLQTIFKNTPEAIINVGFKGEILEINPTGLHMLQVDLKRKLDRKGIFDFIHPEDIKRFKRFHNSVGIGNKKTEKFRIVGLKKEEHWVETSAVPLLDEERHVISVLTINRDITEQQKAQEQIIYHAKLFENITDAIISLDKNLHILSWNTGAEKTYGWKEKEVLGKRLPDVLPADITEEERNDVNKQFFTGGHWKGEMKYYHKNGELLTVLASGSLLKDDPGNVTGIVAVHRDITDRKRSEERAVQSEKKFRELFENSPDAIFVEDENGVILDVNHVACEFQGYSKSELIGKNILDITPDPYKNEVLSGFEKLFNLPNFTLESFSWDKNWNPRPVEIKTNRISFNGKPALLLHVRDISKRKKAEKEKRDSEIKFDTLSGQLPVAIYHVDNSGKFVLVNNRFLEIFEIESEDAVNDEWMSRIHPDDLPMFMLKREESMGTPNKLKIHYRLLINGKIKYVLGKSNPLLNDEGIQIGRIGTIIDLTETKLSRDQIQFTQTMFQNIFEHSPDPIYIKDLDGTILNANHKACLLHGFEYEELIGKNILDLTPAAHREEIMQQFRGFSDGTLQRLNTSVWNKEGDMINVGIRANLINYFDKVALLLHVLPPAG